MANTYRVLRGNLSPRKYPVKGSAEAIEISDFVFFENRFQANTAQLTVRPASAGSTGASAGDGRYQFAQLFVGVAAGRHDLNSFDKNIPVDVDCEVEAVLCNSVGVATVATSSISPGTLVGVAVNGSFVALNGCKVQVDGHHSVTVAANQAIGALSREVKTGDGTCWVHIKGMHVFSQTGN